MAPETCYTLKSNRGSRTPARYLGSSPAAELSHNAWEPPGGNSMSLTHLNRSLAAGIATGALLFAAQPVLAADGGTVTGVVSDASG
jgi:hypothetical protein